MDSGSTNRRSGARYGIGWHGECEVGDGFVMGRVRDIGRNGVFFQPVTELLGSPSWETGEVPLLLRRGDKVSFLYETAPGKTEVSVFATVKWVGKSHHHGESGVGLEFVGRREKNWVD